MSQMRNPQIHGCSFLLNLLFTIFHGLEEIGNAISSSPWGCGGLRKLGKHYITQRKEKSTMKTI